MSRVSSLVGNVGPIQKSVMALLVSPVSSAVRGHKPPLGGVLAVRASPPCSHQGEQLRGFVAHLVSSGATRSDHSPGSVQLVHCLLCSTSSVGVSSALYYRQLCLFALSIPIGGPSAIYIIQVGNHARGAGPPTNNTYQFLFKV